MALRTGQLDGRFFPASRADIVEYWAPESLVLANNASVPVWTGRFRGAVAYQGTGANQPTFHTSALNGLPGLYCQNSHWMRVVDPKDLLTILNPANSVANLARGYTVIGIYLGDGTASSKGVNAAIMGNASGTGANLYMQASGGVAGRNSGSNNIPITNSGLQVIVHTNPQLLAGGSTSTDQLSATYVNGTRVPKPVQGSVNYGSSDIIFGSGSNAAAQACRGTLLGFIIIQRELTYPEVIYATRWAFDKYGQTYPWAGQAYFPVFIGDSIDSGTGTTAVAATYSYLIAMGGKSYSLGLGVGGWGNLAGSGYTLNAMEHVAQKHLVGLSGALGGIPLMIFWHGYRNDQGGSAYVARQNASINRIKAQCPGSKVIVMTPTDYSTTSGNQAAASDSTCYTMLTTYDADARTGIDGYAMLHTHPIMGGTGAHTNVTYTYVAGVTTYWFSDYIHTGDQGNDLAIGAYAGPIAQALYAGGAGPYTYDNTGLH
jgi:hypothetical protein